MDKNGTTVKSKTIAAKKTAVVKAAGKSVGNAGSMDWMTLVGLVAGGLAYLGYILLSNLTLDLSENLQIAVVITLSVFSIAGAVLSILGMVLAKDFTKHNLLGLNIIGLVISFLAFDKFLPALISVFQYLFQK